LRIDLNVLGFKGPKQRNAIIFDITPNFVIDGDTQLTVEAVDASTSSLSFTIPSSTEE
jgi:hypothetical protein